MTHADQLMADLQSVVSDAEALLRATQHQTGAGIDEVRSRAEESVRSARQKIDALQGDVAARTREAAKAADDYVRNHPWSAIGVAAGVAFVIGLLVARR